MDVKLPCSPSNCCMYYWNPRLYFWDYTDKGIVSYISRKYIFRWGSDCFISYNKWTSEVSEIALCLCDKVSYGIIWHHKTIDSRRLYFKILDSVYNMPNLTYRFLIFIRIYLVSVVFIFEASTLLTSVSNFVCYSPYFLKSHDIITAAFNYNI